MSSFIPLRKHPLASNPSNSPRPKGALIEAYAPHKPCDYRNSGSSDSLPPRCLPRMLVADNPAEATGRSIPIWRAATWTPKHSAQATSVKQVDPTFETPQTHYRWI